MGNIDQDLLTQYKTVIFTEASKIMFLSLLQVYDSFSKNTTKIKRKQVKASYSVTNCDFSWHANNFLGRQNY